MKNLFALLFVSLIGLSACSSSNDNNDDYYFNNSLTEITPPSWIQGTWVYANSSVEEAMDLTYQFTSDNFLIMGTDTLNYQLAIEESGGDMTIDLQKYTSDIYILDIALNDTENAYYKFVKTGTTEMKQVQMDDEGVWFFNKQ